LDTNTAPSKAVRMDGFTVSTFLFVAALVLAILAGGESGS
jgi:hypothetical protein